MTGAVGAEGAALPHPDDEELAAAQAAAQADETKEAAPAEGAPAAAADPAAAVEPVMIPKPRFDEVRIAGQRAASEALYWRGQADALARVAAGAKPADAGPTPEQEIEQIETAIETKAKDFDEGRIGLAEFKRFERQASQRISALTSQPAAPPAHNADDMRLEELTAALETTYPVLQVITKAEVDRVLPIARAELEFEGVKSDGSPRATYLLRERVSQLAQARFGQKVPAAQAAAPIDPKIKAAQDKVALAGRMAPNLASVTAGNRPADPMSDEKFANMDADDWAALPDSTRNARLFAT